MKFRRGVGALLAVLAAVSTAVGCTSPESPTAEIGTVVHAPVSEIVEAPATVVARATTALTAPAAGTVAKLYVQDGDTVRKGQIIAKISSPQARQQLAEAKRADREASRPISVGASPAAVPPLRLRLSGSLDARVAKGLTRARKAAKAVKDRAVRAQLLAAIDAAEAQHRAHQRALSEVVNGLNRSLSQVLSQVTSQLGTSLSGLTSSMSAMQAASRSQTKAAVRAAQRTVDSLVITAPFTGVVTLGGPSRDSAAAGLTGLIGQLPAGLSGQVAAPAATARSAGMIATGVPVSAGDTIATVTDVSTLTLSADVDETDVLQVRGGSRAEAEFDAVTGAVYPATVTGVGITPKEGTGGGVSYPVRLSLGKGTYDDGTPAPAPKPGMSAVVRLTLRSSPNAVAVPASAVVTSGKETIVWAVRAGRAERRVVRLGAQADAVVEILTGVRPGEHVVVKGADSIRPGQPLP